MSKPTFPFRLLQAGTILSILIAAPAAWADKRQEASDQAWEERIRPGVFGERDIVEGPGQDVLEVRAPFRAEDASIVPISIHALIPQEEQRHVRRLHVYIDKNPIPLVGVFEFTTANGRADLAMRVRVDDFTFVRAIAETNDGELYMAKSFVRSTGGCSAPPSKSLEEALATLGRMKVGLVGNRPLALGEPNLMQLRVSHPNVTGMAVDRRTNAKPPAWFLNELEVSYGNQTVLRGNMTFSISQDPSFRFFFVPKAEDTLAVRAVDTKGDEFTATQPLATLTAGGSAKADGGV